MSESVLCCLIMDCEISMISNCILNAMVCVYKQCQELIVNGILVMAVEWSSCFDTYRADCKQNLWKVKNTSKLCRILCRRRLE